MKTTPYRFKYLPDIKILAIGVIYLGASWLGFELSFDGATNIPIWPAAGVALALLLILGRESWPGVLVGAIITYFFAFWSDPQMNAYSVLIVVVGIAGGVTLQALLGNYLYQLWIDQKDAPFAKSKYAFTFLFIAALTSLISSGVYIGVLYAIPGYGFEMNPLKIFTGLWTSNLAGLVIFTPLILSWKGNPQLHFSREKAIESVVLMALIAIIIVGHNIEYFQSTIESAFPFVVIPVLMWLSFRYPLNVTYLVMTAVVLAATLVTTNGLGPFQMTDTFNTMLLLQAFGGVVALSTLITSSTVRERNTVQTELESFNENLEGKVDARTKLLNEEITIRTRAEEKLRVSNRKLRKINSELDNFVYSVSHDLRAPIASVLGLINLAKKDKTPGMAMKYIDLIKDSAIQQDMFIKKILDQSRNARLKVQREEIRFEQIIEDSFKQLKYLNLNGQVKKNIKIEQSEPFYSDPWRLNIVFNNLLSNAIRYKNGRTPVVNIEIAIANGTANIMIADNGRGIPKKHLRHVFKMFYRATDKNAGSGLGLYIVKETLEKLNGDIKLDSQEGKGTKIDLHIPSLN